MRYSTRIQQRWAPLPHTTISYGECAVCDKPGKCMTHDDYIGMPVCFDCFDAISPPVDDDDHTNHWRNSSWDKVARHIGREVVPHGVLQDGVYYPDGTNPPVNRPLSNHIGLVRKAGTAEERRAHVQKLLGNG